MLLVACEAFEKYDDTELRNEVTDLANRVAKLEQLCQQLNTNIGSLQTIVTALEQNDFITSVSPINEGGKVIGYTITFAKNGSITIYHGEDGKDGQDGANGNDGVNGADGKDGATPQIGVKQDDDGVYYWTLNGEWLTDENGNKIKAEGSDGKDGQDGTNGSDGANGNDGQDGTNGSDGQDGKDGKDGITPQLKIEDEYWYVSYDNGATWTKLGKATGEDGKDGADGTGAAGDSIIKELTQDEGYVYITLYDGTSFVLPKMSNSFNITFSATENIACPSGETVSIDYTITGGDENTLVEAIGKDGWMAEIVATDATKGKVQVTAPANRSTGKVIVLANNGAGQTVMKSLTFGEGILTGIADAYEIDLNGGTISIAVRTNLDYSVYIPTEAAAWLSAAVSRAEVRDETLTLTIQANDTGAERSAVIELRSMSEEVLQRVEITQKATADIPTEGNITFVDPEVEKVLVKHFDTNLDGKLSYAEAAAVTSFSTGNTSIFYGNTKIRFFDEFQYFTGVRSLINGSLYTGGQFRGCDKLLQITLPESLEHIGSYSFSGCSNLTKITIPKSVTKIGAYAFEYCTHLQVTFSEGSLTTIQEHAFDQCTRMTEAILPESVIEIGYRAFKYCTSLKRVQLPTYLSEIPHDCFVGCSSLEEINLPDFLMEIGSDAFSGCSKLKAISLPDHLDELGGYAFQNCTALTSIKLPQHITSFGSSIFKGSGLTTIEFEEGIKKIPSTICSGCANLKTVIIPESVTTIDNEAFMASGLTEFTIPDHITTINEKAFYGTKLTSLVVPKGVGFGSQVFGNCDALKSVVIEEGVTSVGDLFYDCDALTDVTLPSTLTKLDGTFQWCTALTSIQLPASLTTIGDATFNSVSITSIELPASLTTIGEYAFAYMKKLTSLTLPENVSSIGSGAFRETPLTSFMWPKKVKTVSSRAFQGCTALTSITLHDDVTGIDSYAFLDCTALQNITLPASVETIGSNAFQGSSLTEIVLPKLTQFDYAFYGCKALAKVTFHQYQDFIDRYAFHDCDALTKVVLPDAVTTISTNAFYGCAKLAEVQFSNSLQTIASSAFAHCDSLTSIDLPATVTSISSAFSGCSALESVYCRATTPPKAESSAFNNTPRKALYVPEASILSYRNATGWSGFTTVQALPAE